MRRAVFLRALDEIYSQRLLLLLLAVLLIMPLGVVPATRTLGPDELAIWFTLVAGAGAIGRDQSSGALALALTRPIKRRDYVLAKWAGVAAAAAIPTLLQLALEAGVLWWKVPSAFLLVSNHPGYAAITRASLCVGVSAVLVALSTLVASGGNVLIVHALAYFCFRVMEGQGSVWELPWLARAGHELGATLVPRLEGVDVLRASPPSWFAVSSFVSTVVLALALAVVRLNRAEESPMPPSDAAAGSTRELPVGLLGLALLLLLLRIGAGVWEADHPIVHDLVNWKPLAGAEALAAPEKKAVLYVFGAAWCEPCRRMERELFDDPKVSDSINRRFVPVHIDVDAQAADEQVKALRARHAVRDLPTLVVAPTDPKKLHGPQLHVGYRNADEVRRFLELAPTIP